MIAIGESIDLAKEFSYAIGGAKSKGPLSQLFGRRTIVSVYMKNNTSACDNQMLELAREADSLAGLGWTLIGLSKDPVGSHLKFAAAKGISFALVSDPDKDFAQMTDSLVEKSMYGKKYLAPARAAYLFDEKGTLLELVPEVDAKNHAAQIREALGRLGEAV